jgi:hypothetical protein
MEKINQAKELSDITGRAFNAEKPMESIGAVD